MLSQTGTASPLSVALESDLEWRTALVIPGINCEVTEHQLLPDSKNLFEGADIIHHGYPFLTPSLSWLSVYALSRQYPNALHVVDLTF